MQELNERNFAGTQHRFRKDFRAGCRFALVTALVALLASPLAASADTSTQYLLHNSLNGGSGKYGTWGLTYTCTTCHSKGASQNVKKVSQQITTPIGLRKVTFMRYTSISVILGRYTAAVTNAVGVLGNDRRTINPQNSNYVCEVCHHRTSYHQYSSSKIADKNHTQHKSNNKDCTGCHAHNAGFRRPSADACDACHGNPPTTIAGSIGSSKTGLYTNALGSPPPNAGAHDKHRNVLKFECQTCHNNFGHGLLGNDMIEIGFRIVSTNWKPFVGEVTKGTFTGTIGGGFNNEYAVAPNNPNTTLLRVQGAASCNIYCHGDNWSVPSGRSGSGVSWTQGPLGSCSNAVCHGTTPQNPPTPVLLGNISTGAHKTHVGKLQSVCTTCHEDLPDPHMVNGRVNVNMTQANAGISAISTQARYNGFTMYSTHTLAASGSYFSCSNMYCHSNVQGGNGSGAPTTYKTVAWGGGRLACDGCHGGMRTSFSPISTGAHRKHISTATYRYACNACHQAAGSDDQSKHGNKNIDVVMGGSFGGTYSQATNVPGDGFGSCANVNCHYGNNVAWSDPPLTCNGCHGGDGSTLSSGRHAGHISTAANPNLGTAIGCVACHSNVLSSDARIADYLKHANGYSDYSGAKAGGSGSYSTATGVCSNSYCHTDGKGSQNVPFTEANGWKSGMTYNGCKGCHGNDTTLGHYTSVVGEPNYQNAGMTQPRANSHDKHMGGTTLAVCVYCHNQTMDASGAIFSGTTTHTNGRIDVQAGGGKSFGYDRSTRTCSTILCHGSGSVPVRWGQPFPTDCTGCHGNNALSQRPISSGKHKAHTNNKQILGINFSCAACHALTAASTDRAIVDTTVHGNGFKNVTGVMSGGRNTYTTATGVCSATYCHSDGKGKRNAPFDATNGWKSTVTLGCTGCHGNDTAPEFSSVNGEPNYVSSGAGTLYSNDHKNHVDFGAATCIDCHADTVDAEGKLKQDVTLHLNRSIDVVSGNGKTFDFDKPTKTCSNIYCHGGKGSFSQIWGTPVSADCTGCHGNNSSSSNPIVSGKHGAHINNDITLGSSYNCTACHAKTINADERSFADRTMHGNGFIDYSGAKAGGSATYTTATGVCANSYCHSDGKGRQNVPFAEANGWKSGVVYNGCKGCHGNDATLNHYSSIAGEPNYQNQFGQLRSNSHLKHAKAGASTCYSCHSDTVTTAGTAIAATGKHTDGAIDVKQGGTASFSGWTASGKTCASISCHFNKNAVWGDTLNCNSCHGNDAATLTSKKHSAHISTTANPSLGTALGCVECHAKTVSDNSTISNPARHANSFADYSGARAGGSYDNATGVCSATYCHSDGKGRVNEPFTAASGWNSSVVYTDCKQCHGNDTVSGSFTGRGGEPNYPNEGAGLFRANSHDTHTSKLTLKNAASCDYCHNGTVITDGTGIKPGGLHLNNGIDVTFNTAKAGNGTYDRQNRTCSNTSCHGSSTARWGDALSAGCKTCHSNLSASHGKHIGDLLDLGLVTMYNYTANKSSGSVYRIGCANCHPTVEAGNHRNGTVELSINRYKTGGSWLNGLNQASADGISATSSASGIKGTAGASVSCELSYCHSSGKSTDQAQNAFRGSPDWYGTFSGNRCGMCHDNPPQYEGQSHYVAESSMGNNNSPPYKDSGHMVGIHFKNTSKGPGEFGFLGYSNSGNKAHGNRDLATTMACAICHSGIVSSIKVDTYAMFGTGSKFNCSNCHTASTRTPLQAGEIVDTALHLNGRKDVAFPTVDTTFATKAQLSNVANALGWTRNGAYKSADSFDSFNLRDSAWNSADKSCMTSCHVNQPGITWGAKLKCSSCHANQ